TEDGGVLARGVDTRLLQQGHDALGCARNKERLAAPLRELANVVSTEAIDVLLIHYGRRDGVLPNVLGERKLHDDAVDIWVVVQAVQLIEQLGLGDILRIVQKFAGDTGLLDGSTYCL